jgi:hypothetical protein
MPRPLATAGAVVLLAGCTSVVRGHGQAIGTPSSPRSSTTTSTPPSTSVAPSPSPSPTQPAADIARPPVATAIGDPVTADLCTAIGLDALRGLGNGLTPSFDDRQYPPGCSITLNDGAKPLVGITVFAGVGDPLTSTGRTSRVANGQTIYSYPFDATTGSCRREIKAHGVLLTVDSYPNGDAKPGQATSCAGTDQMASRLAAVVTAGNVPRQPLASPSLSALDACKVAEKASITTLPAFAGSELREQGFGANCQLRPHDLFLFIDFVIADVAQPPGSTPTTVGGHRLSATSSQADFCSYASTQGTTTDGRYEQVTATATVAGSGAAPAQLCEQTAEALARYLTAAGLQ